MPRFCLINLATVIVSLVIFLILNSLSLEETTTLQTELVMMV
jgi:hypothetical protein